MRNLLLVALTTCAPPHVEVTPMPAPTVQPLPSNVEDVSARLEPIRAKHGLPALAAAAWRGGELLAIGATGKRKVGGPSVSLDDRWHLGSDTKAMTAMLVAVWVDRGKLHFDDTLGALFGDGVHPDYRAVTLEQVLRHRGGLPHQFPDDIWHDMWRAGTDVTERNAAVGMLLGRPPAQSPGTFQYANTGYVTLGVALERVTGRRWEDLIRADLFVPLGMSSCGFGAPDSESPQGHRRVGDELQAMEGADNPPSNAPAGGVHCSLRDWGKFLAVVLAGARGDHVTLVQDATLKRLLTPAPEAGEKERYAGGWTFTTRTWAGGVALTHAGSNTMWMAIAWLAPEKNLSFVAASNVDDFRAVDEAFSKTIPLLAK